MAFVLLPLMGSLSSTSQCCVWGVCLAALCSFGCIRETIPDPRAAAQAYAQAASRGDADAIYSMLDSRSKQSISADDVRRIVADERKELADQAAAIGSLNTEVRASARLRFADGEDAVLEVRNGGFYIASADALPAGARTPEQALDELRRVLARRSYAGLMRVLTDSSRSAVDSNLRSLVEGLENPQALDVEQTGETATVRVGGGHTVKLRREAGIWRVEDFE